MAPSPHSVTTPSLKASSNRGFRPASHSPDPYKMPWQRTCEHSQVIRRRSASRMGRAPGVGARLVSSASETDSPWVLPHDAIEVRPTTDLLVKSSGRDLSKLTRTRTKESDFGMSTTRQSALSTTFSTSASVARATSSPAISATSCPLPLKSAAANLSTWLSNGASATLIAVPLLVCLLHKSRF